jgi:hypothetical protein
MNTCSNCIEFPHHDRIRRTDHLHFYLAQAKLLLHKRQCSLEHIFDRDRLATDSGHAPEGSQMRDNLSSLADLLHGAVQLLQYALLVSAAQFHMVNGVPQKETYII